MSPGVSRLDRRRLSAPAENGQTLIEPPLSDVGALIAENRSQRKRSKCELLGWSLAELSSQAQRELIDSARQATAEYRDIPAVSSGPLLLAGHQPQLFHAGVWFKNFVLGGLAQRHNGLAVNLVIDSDTLRSPSIRVPGGTIDQPTARAITFDAPGPQIPFEERAILDRSEFESFGRRAMQEFKPLVAEPLLERFWPLAIERSQTTSNLGQCLAQARHQIEGEWGLATLELPQSRVCDLPSFHWFAAHLLNELPQFREIYNRSLLEYRRLHSVRSKNHPAPELTAEDDWLEAPFWIWSTDDPRRRRLFVRHRDADMVLSDHAGTQIECPGGNGLAEALSELPRRRIKLRTRALITTLWARLALGDLFLHGIGGAKYDHLTDLIMQRFFGVSPPAFLTVTATLRLPIGAHAISSEQAQQVQLQLRDLEFHPERWLGSSIDQPEVRQLVQQKADWIACQPTQQNARTRCRAIRKLNQQLAPWTQSVREQIVQRHELAAAHQRAAGILSSREYAFCLFPEETLRHFMLEFLARTSYPRAT